MTLLIIAIIVSALYVGLNYRNSLLLIRSEERDAKARNIAPVMPQTPIPMKHKVSYIIDWIIVITVLALLFSCTAMKSGYYTISEIRGSNTVVLKEVAGDWHIPNSDSLKIGQRIYLQRTKETGKINVW